MCSPNAVIAGVSLASSLLGSATKVQAGKQAQAAANYNSAISQRNADVAEMKSADALAQGQKDQEKARQESQAKMGYMATKIGASNIALDSGSALNMLADSAQLGELDALDIGAKAERQSQDYLRAAADGRNQALISKQDGKNSMNNALLSAGSSLLNAGESLLKGPNRF